MYRKYLEKFSKSCQVWFFLPSWFLMIKFHVLNALMTCDFRNSNLTKKSKFDFSVYNWLFHQLTKFQLSINWSWEMFWTMPLGWNYVFGFLISCLKPDKSCTGVESQKSSLLSQNPNFELLVFGEVSWSDQSLCRLESI